MPLYDYTCPANGRTVEVSHSMRESITTWGQLCKIANLNAGDTPPSSPVKKLIAVPAALAKPGAPSGGGGCCGVAGCGPHH